MENGGTTVDLAARVAVGCEMVKAKGARHDDRGGYRCAQELSKGLVGSGCGEGDGDEVEGRVVKSGDKEFGGMPW